jgi:hypothetical protein
LVDYLPSELCDVSLVESGGWGVWSGNTYRGWGVLSVLNWKGEDKSWNSLGPCGWVLGRREFKVLKYVR